MKKMIKKNIQLIAVSIGHFTNDFYMNLIPPILYIFTEEMGLTLTQQAFIVTVLTLSSTLLQPIIGYFLDKIGKASMLTYGIIWITIGMSVTGVINNYYILIVVVALAGIASSVYHPLGSAIAANLTEGSQGKSLSIFMTIGGFATVFTPLVTVPMATHLGRWSLVLLVIPGLFVAYFLKKSGINEISYIPEDVEEKHTKSRIGSRRIFWLTMVVIIAIIKVLITRILLAFGIQILTLKGLDLIFAGIILSIHLFARTVGTLTGGFMSDKLGEKNIMIIFNSLTLAGYLLMTFTTGIVSAIGFIFIGYSLNATATANITLTHKILPENITLGTGMIMGFASTVASVAILGFGKIADQIGLLDTSQLFNALIFITIIISITLPKQYSDSQIVNEEDSNVC
jgi:FSR family fosmidomycin resistance protein-like MFS transporter